MFSFTSWESEISKCINFQITPVHFIFCVSSFTIQTREIEILGQNSVSVLPSVFPWSNSTLLGYGINNWFCRYFMYDGLKHTCVEGDHIVNIFSFSKAYGMMGWRVGYVSNGFWFLFLYSVWKGLVFLNNKVWKFVLHFEWKTKFFIVWLF